MREFGKGSGSGKLWSKLLRKIEPEQDRAAMKKRKLLPQEGTGKRGEGGGLELSLAVA